MSVTYIGATQVKAKGPTSIRIRHRNKRSGIALVPLNNKPIMGLRRKCPTCQIIHPVKTVHLYLDVSGACLVSSGVFDLLKGVGLPDLDVVADIVNPPPITLGKSRFQVDQQNNRIQLWKEPVIVKST